MNSCKRFRKSKEKNTYDSSTLENYGIWHIFSRAFPAFLHVYLDYTISVFAFIFNKHFPL